MNANKNAVVKEQLSLFVQSQKKYKPDSILAKLTRLLQSNLNFHNESSNYYSHNFHSFPAKFPPQLPKIFIGELTEKNQIVLDPMVGSGTTIIEAYLAQRKGIGLDIDPLALKIAKVKTTSFDKRKLIKYGLDIYENAKRDFEKDKDKLNELLRVHFDHKTKEFVDYWFLPETQLELISILRQIERIEEESYKTLFEVIFSSLIITKSGGVSLALDLGHTRPHKVKALLDGGGNVIYGNRNFNRRKKDFVAKTVKSSFEEFKKKLGQNVESVFQHPIGPEPEINFCDSQNLYLKNETVDLIVTSPPYASNAIDYMRAHKFSLVWFGYKIGELTQKKDKYIGSEATLNYSFEKLPPFTSQKIADVERIDARRGRVLRRYFSEMKRSLGEMYRVLKPGKAAVVVVGNSTMKGIDTEIYKCLKEIGVSIGFIVPHIGVRELDRNKRMLPTSKKRDLDSQIQKRMHEEYVIGFYKPL